MTKILKILALVAAVVAVSIQHSEAQLQTYSFNVLASVTSNLTVAVAPIDVSSQKDVAIKWTVQLGGAGTEVMGIRFVPSIDNTIATTPPNSGYYIAVAAAGATPVTVQTNFSVAGYRYLIGYYVTNANATFVLTNTVSAYVKRNAP